MLHCSRLRPPKQAEDSFSRDGTSSARGRDGWGETRAATAAAAPVDDWQREGVLHSKYFIFLYQVFYRNDQHFPDFSFVIFVWYVEYRLGSPRTYDTNTSIAFFYT